MSLNLKLIDDNVTGAWAIFLRQPFALKYFKLDSNNFVWSFSVILVLILFQIFAMPIENEIFDNEVATGLSATNISYKIVVLALNWFSWPIVAFIICKLMSIETHFIRYVTIDNWTGLITQTIAIAPVMLFQFGLPSGLAITTMLAASLIILLFKWRVAKLALDTNSLNASILLFVDVAYSIIISFFLTTLFV